MTVFLKSTRYHSVTTGIAVLPDITVGCRETMHLCLKATKSASNLGRWVSNDPFSDDYY